MTEQKESFTICFLGAGDSCVVEFLEELHEITWANNSKSMIAEALFHDKLHEGYEAFATGHRILLKKLKRFGKLTGRTFEIENLGKRYGKNYYEYKVTELKQVSLDEVNTNE